MRDIRPFCLRSREEKRLIKDEREGLESTEESPTAALRRVHRNRLMIILAVVSAITGGLVADGLAQKKDKSQRRQVVPARQESAPQP